MKVIQVINADLMKTIEKADPWKRYYYEVEDLKEPGTVHFDRDPFGKDQHEPGAKLDANKPDASLLLSFSDALMAVAKVGTYGAAKYTRDGWYTVPNGFQRYTAAMLRHVFEEHELYDPDTELLHAAHVAWNALARLQLLLIEREIQNKTLTNATEPSLPCNSDGELDVERDAASEKSPPLQRKADMQRCTREGTVASFRSRETTS